MLLLLACTPSKLTLDGTSTDRSSSARLAAVEARLDDAEARLDEAEGRLDDAEATATTQQAALDTLSAGLASLGATVDGIDGATGAVTAYGHSEATGRGGAGSTWESVTSADLAIHASAGAFVLASCSLTNAGTDAQYRTTISAADGSWSDDAEATGDATDAPLHYSGEAATMPGFWTVPGEGDYTIACEGRYASAFDITITAVVVP